MNIGGVTLNLDYYDDSYKYSDGAEDTLLEYVQSGRDVFDIMRGTDEWAVLYHLHPDRQNILKWYPFTGNERVLEVGSGCGALTSLLAESCTSVTCNDISLKRSEINAQRNKNFDNIEIYVSNFMDMPEGKYDIITLIGVLEYAASYVGGNDPYGEMLRRLRDMLEPNGVIIAAIENQYGLKYWAGCREDHLGEYYAGIEGYAPGSKVRTFSRNALQQMFEDAGFKNIEFYYPMPDYKFAYQIFSDKRLPERGELKNLIHNYDATRLETFNEERVYDGIIDEGMFPFFANSFLVKAEG